MRKPSWITKSGPFVCSSLVNGYILVKPSWPQYGAVWEEHGGGGPGFPGRMGLASDLSRWLNATYTDEQMKEGQERIALHDKNMEKAEKAFKKQRREIPDA